MYKKFTLVLSSLLLTSCVLISYPFHRSEMNKRRDIKALAEEWAYNKHILAKTVECEKVVDDKANCDVVTRDGLRHMLTCHLERGCYLR
jgi:hypothetical protein